MEWQQCLAHGVTRRDPGYIFKSPYALENGKETGVWLLLQHGTSPRLMPISLVSNQRFTEVTTLAVGFG